MFRPFPKIAIVVLQASGWLVLRMDGDLKEREKEKYTFHLK